MAGTAIRLLGALVAGAALVLSVGGLHYGVGQGFLGLVREPQESFAPQRWRSVPPDRPARLLLVGTSLTARGSWSDGVQMQLSACRPGGVLVERLARGGASSAWGEAALGERLARAGAEPPDLIVIEFSINDASLWHGMTLGKSRSRHAAMLDLAAQAGVPVFLATMSPAFGREALERPGQMAYRAAYPGLARDHGAGLIAMVPRWTALDAAARRQALPDRLHPTDAAMEAVAVPALVEALAPVLCAAG